MKEQHYRGYLKLKNFILKIMVQCQVFAKNKSHLPTKAPCAKQASIQSPVTTCLHTLMATKNFMVLDKDGATRWVHSRGFSVEIPPSWLTTYHKTVTLHKCVHFSLTMSISHMLQHIFKLIFSDISKNFRNFSCLFSFHVNTMLPFETFWLVLWEIQWI